MVPVKTCTSKFALCEPLGCSDPLLLMCQSWEQESHEAHDHGLPVCPAIHLSIRRKLRTEKGSLGMSQPGGEVSGDTWPRKLGWPKAGLYIVEAFVGFPQPPEPTLCVATVAYGRAGLHH